MKKLILTFCTLLLISSLAGCSFKRTSPEEIEKIVNKAKESKLIALDVYHDRCESCKQIEPIIKELESDYSGNSNIAFLKYDLSNPFTIIDSRKVAKGLGLENIYKSQRFSGVVLIIDNENKKVLDILVGEQDINRYRDLIERKLKDNAA